MDGEERDQEEHRAALERFGGRMPRGAAGTWAERRAKRAARRVLRLNQYRAEGDVVPRAPKWV